MQRYDIVPLTIMSVLLLTSSIASPWGAIGHRIVARIAEQHLSAEARQQLQALLGPESLAQVRYVAGRNALGSGVEPCRSLALCEYRR
jgi:S1/P1 Nuclease